MSSFDLLLLFISFLFVIVVYQRNSNREHVTKEKIFEMTLRSIGEAVIVTDIHGCIVSLNPNAERLTGWYFKDAKGHALSEVFRVVNTHSGMPVNDLVNRAQQEEGIVVLAEDSMLIAADGNRYQIYEHGAPIYDDAGKIIGVVLVFRDITQEHELKNCLNENTLRLQQIIDTSMDAVIVTDEQGIINEWNPAAANMFGWSHEEIIKQPVHKLIIQKKFRERYMQYVRRLIKNADKLFLSKHIESLGLHRDGHTFPINMSMTSTQTENGYIFNAFIRDMTGQKNSIVRIKPADDLC